MGCTSNRKKQTRLFQDQKWEYINLADFKAKGCGAGFAYGYLWFSLFLSIAVYGIDSFTAVQLIAFNEWSSKIEPAIPFNVSRWIFSVCILLSFINLAFEYVRAWRVMKRGNVAETFLDNLAVRLESIRMGSGQGWRRFLVFAALTKSKKGAEYVALFTYFSFKSWIRVIFCSGPRQVVNALTLKSVYEAKLAPTATSVDGAILGFFDKIKVLATEDYQQAIILSGMCFTFVIWAFAALFLLLAVCFYVFFLFHWIPRADGGLSGYCERKVNKKLLRIVTTKVNKALAKGQADLMKSDFGSGRLRNEKPILNRAGTLPTLPNVTPIGDDGLPEMPTIGRDEKTAQLPMYTSRPGSPGSIELSALDARRPLHRTGTGGSVSSYSSRAPLTSAAADMGYRSNSPAPTIPDIDLGMVPPIRPGTSNSQRSFNSPRPGFNHLNTPSTSSSLRMPMTASPAPMEGSALPPFPGPARVPTNRSMDSFGPPQPVGRSNTGPLPPTSTARQYQAYNPNGRSSPAPPYDAHGAGAGVQQRLQTPNHRGVPPPVRSMTGPVGSMPPGSGGPRLQQPQRNMTAPGAPRNGPADYYGMPASGRSGAPPPRRPQQNGGASYGYDLESQNQQRYY